jgi:hypothetical protein
MLSRLHPCLPSCAYTPAMRLRDARVITCSRPRMRKNIFPEGERPVPSRTRIAGGRRERGSTDFAGFAGFVGSTSQPEIIHMAPREPTFDINDPVLQEIIKQAVEARMAAEKAAAQTAEKAVNTDKTDQKILKVFRAKGYKDLVLFDRTKLLSEQPDVTLLTFSKWMDLGRKVKEGEHSLRVPGYQVRLFHKSQTRIATVEERKANFTKVNAAAERRDAKKAGAEQATA